MAVIAILLLAMAGADAQVIENDVDGVRVRLEKLAAAPGNNVEHLQFVDAAVGWAYQSRGPLWRTADGGSTWRQTQLPECTAEGGWLLAARFWDRRSGYIHYCDKVFVTADAANTWTVFPIPETSPINSGVDSVWIALGQQRAWIGGSVYRELNGERGGPHWAFDDTLGYLRMAHAFMLRTTDGGRTWQAVSLPGADQHFLVREIVFPSEDIGLAATLKGLFRTADGGKTWHTVKYPESCILSSFPRREGELVLLHFLDERTGWAAFDDGHIVQTRDGGLTWCSVLGPPGRTPGTISQLHFFSAEVGMGLLETSKLVVTQDGGRSWRRLAIPEFARSLSFLDRLHGWIVTDEAILRVRIGNVAE